MTDVIDSECDNMKWYEISIKTDGKYSEIVSNFFHLNGSNGVLIEDNKKIDLDNDTGEIYIDEDKFDESLRDVVEVKGYYNEVEDVIKLIKEELDLSKIEISYFEINDEWKQKWKEGFKKIKITDDILIKPSWDKNKYDEKIQIKIDPGMAFGTGTHGTTSLSIKMIEKYLKKDDKVLDVGCGSGILSIVASKLNAKKIVAIDIDEEAIKASKENFIMNNVDNVELLIGNLKDLYFKKTDILVANILSEILVMLIKDFVNVLDENSIFISSGIIIEKVDLIKEIYIENGLEIIDEDRDGDWAVIVAKKKK